MIVDACPNVYLRQNYALIQTPERAFTASLTGNISNNRLEDTFREHIDIIIPCLQKDWDNCGRKAIVSSWMSLRESTFKLVF